MRRSLVLALMLSVGHASIALAGGSGETLLQSGQRITRLVAKAPPSPAIRLAQQAQATLAQSGMGKGKKILIALGIAGAFAGVALAVDRGVEDSTPSSLGQR